MSVKNGVWGAALLLIFSSASLAGLPTVEEVLQVHRDNRDRLTTLHVQLTHTHEWTDAHRQRKRKEAENRALFLKAIEEGGELTIPEESVPEGYSAEQFVKLYIEQIRMEAKMPLAENRRSESRYEFFLRGEDYQVRIPLRFANTEFGEEWAFPDAPLTVSSLPSEYAMFQIFSRSVRQTPPAYIWPGKPRPDSSSHWMLTSQHVSEYSILDYPPFMTSLHPEWIRRHPIDEFFSATPERYRVAGEEERDGRKLTIVDASVPLGLLHSQTVHFYRAWLDLERGAIPMVLEFRYGTEDQEFDDVLKVAPRRITTMRELRQLGNGAFYPAMTVMEEFSLDPNVPEPTPEEWAEVRAGKRTVPQVVFERRTWACARVDVGFPRDEEFFVLPVPEGVTFYDKDAGKVVGALDRIPPVRAGEPAPPLKIARWLDGRERTLEDLRGKVVVLDFWGLWCGACRNALPQLKQLQEKYRDQPVVFISIHTAESDTDALAERIRKFTAEQGWDYLAAIDAGTMIENSQTSRAYGVDGFPTEVVIGKDGLITFNSAVPPEGMEEIHGKHRHEITPQDEAKINAFMQKLFEAAGEVWPLPEDLSEEERRRVNLRMAVFHMSRQIDAALAESGAADADLAPDRAAAAVEFDNAHRRLLDQLTFAIHLHPHRELLIRGGSVFQHMRFQPQRANDLFLIRRHCQD